MKSKMNSLATEIVEYLLALPEGTEIATSEVIEALYGHKYLTCGEYEILGEMFGFEDFFVLNVKVHKLAKTRGLILDDSKYDDRDTGLPFHIPYVVRRKATKQ